jgi:hypothetical protein
VEVKSEVDSSLKTNISNACVLICVICGIVAVALNGQHHNSALAPDPTSGRIYGHSIKWFGTVYLMAAEYQPYRWLFGIAIVCVAIFIGLRIIDVFLARRKKRGG